MASQDGNTQMIQEQFGKKFPQLTLLQTPSTKVSNSVDRRKTGKLPPGKATITPSKPSQPAVKKNSTVASNSPVTRLPQTITITKPTTQMITTPIRQTSGNAASVKQNTPLIVSSSAINTPNIGKTIGSQSNSSAVKCANNIRGMSTPKAQTVKSSNPAQSNALVVNTTTQAPIIMNQTLRSKSPSTSNVEFKPTATLKTIPVAMKANMVRPPQTKTPVRPKNQITTVSSPQPQSPLVKTPVRQSAPAATSIGKPPLKTPSIDQSPSTNPALTVYQSLPQWKSNQITITPSSAPNKVLVQQVINNNGQLVIQNKEGDHVEPTVQSVMVGTTGQSVVTPQALEITSSEPLQTLKVSQQVTLIGPKGTALSVQDAKKHVNQQKQHTMTNVVSSTTNSIPPPPPPPPPASLNPPPVQHQINEQKKGILPASDNAEGQQIPVRKVNRSNAFQRQQYPSTQGQVRRVAAPTTRPTKDIPMQKVSPMTMMPPPPLPPPELQSHFANEEEVTTSEETIQPTKIIVILPDGQQQEIVISRRLPLEAIVKDLLEGSTLKQYADSVTVINHAGNQNPPLEQNVDEEPRWEGNAEEAVVGTKSGEIAGLQGVNESGHVDGEATAAVPEPGETTERQDSMDQVFDQVFKEIKAERKEKELQNATHSAIDEPHFRDGLLAVCKACGCSSYNHRNCQRCNRQFPPDVKTVPIDFAVPQKSRKNKADSSDEGPKKKKCRRKKDEQPVCLTISDEDEELGLNRQAAAEAAANQISEDGFHSDSNSNSNSLVSSCDKEPVITDEMVSEMKQAVSGGGPESDTEMIDISDEKCFLQCRTVRIGSYKVVPRDKVLITPHGLKFTVPVLSSDQYVELKIMIKEIVKVLVHYGRQMPVVFFYTRPNAAAKIRNALRMTDKKGFYYDSTSEDETHRRITFLPDKIDDDCKQILKNIFGRPENNLCGELTGKEANDILVKASPKEVQAFIAKKQPPVPPQPQPFDGLNIQTIMIYPPPPEKGGIPINTEDYACLESSQFLNDVIIDFYLKYVVEKTLSPEDRARTHVFSSFFYKRLTTKPPPKRKLMNPVESDPNASPAAKRHSRVKSWTKNVDLFAKDFIVIPINESSHWYLAIVCFPGLTGPVRFSDNTPIDLPGRKKKTNDKKVPDVLTGKHEVTIGSTTITAVTPKTCTLDGEEEEEDDRDEADGLDENMDVPDCDEEQQSQLQPGIKEEPEEEKPVKKQREPIKQPCILIFDSLSLGVSRNRVVATLRDYLRIEYEVKRGHSRDFSGEVLKGSHVRCPQQTNYTDCGLYVLQYVEAFFQWPITDYHIPILQVQDWFKADIVDRKRYEIQQLLHRLMQEQNIDIELVGLPILNLQPEGKLVDYPNSENEEEEEDEDERLCDDEGEMLEEDGDYEMEHGMEEGEIGHYEGEDHDGYMDPGLEHEQPDMDEEEFMDDEEEEDDDPEEDDDEEEEDEEMPEDGDRELDDANLSNLNPVKSNDLKQYRITRLNRSNPTNEG